MSVWYCECHGLHGPMAQCVKASRATFATATGLGGRVSEAPARERPATALSPEAERERLVVAEAQRRVADDDYTFDDGLDEVAPHNLSDRILVAYLLRCLLRSPVASTTLPGEPGKVSLIVLRGEHFYITRGDNGIAHVEQVQSKPVLMLPAPVASLAPTREGKCACGHDVTQHNDNVGCMVCECELLVAPSSLAPTPSICLHPEKPVCRRCGVEVVNLTGATAISLAPTSLADRPECVEAAVEADDRQTGYERVKWMLQAAEAARPPKPKESRHEAR